MTLKWSLPMTTTDVDVLEWSWAVTDADDCRPPLYEIKLSTAQSNDWRWWLHLIRVKANSPLHRTMTDADDYVLLVWNKTLHCTEQWLMLMTVSYSCETKLSSKQNNQWVWRWWLCLTRVTRNSPLHRTIIDADDYHWRELLQVSFLWRQTRICCDKTRLLSRQKYACRDKTFVATNICRDKHNFAVTKVLRQAYFCRDTCGSSRKW